MTTYLDAETTEEEEELIEAVNEMVDKAAIAIYTDLKNDVSGIVFQLRYYFDALFPFWEDWRTDPNAMGRDLQRVCLVCMLYVWALWLLTPSSKWRKDPTAKKRWKNSSNSLQLLRKQLATTFDKKTRRTFKTKQYPTRPLGFERSRSTSSIPGIKRSSQWSFLFQRQNEEEEEDDVNDEEDEEETETEEELFALRWSSILQTNYASLVLPPECKRVDKPKHNPSPEGGDTKSSSRSSESQSRQEAGSDEENPDRRLRNYWHQCLHLLVNLLRYDYVGAGYSLFRWLDWWLRNRQKNRQRQNPEENIDDESEMGDAGMNTGLVRQNSFNSTTSSVSSSGHNRKNQRPMNDPSLKSPRGKSTRSKRDNIVKAMRESGSKKIDLKLSVSEESNHSTDATAAAAFVTATSNRNILENCQDAEEKKEGSQSELGERAWQTPPPSPCPSSHSHPEDLVAPDSVYETPGSIFSLTDPSISKLALLSAKPPPILNGVTKPKDALENYRKPMLRARTTTTTNHPSSTGAPSPARPASRQSDPTASKTTTSTSNDTTDHQCRGPLHQRTDSKAFYFETVSTQDMLKKMSVEVPVPDRNGYIIGDDFLPDASHWKPLLVFVNSRSGPQQGQFLIAQLRGLLNPVQVWDLADGGPDEILESFTASFSRLRILVCGGDGTVSWIVSTIDNMKLQRKPPIAILPLGTGNDLARIHGWGGGYNNEPLTAILEQVAESYISWLDRWEMTVENKKGKVKEVKSFFNYLGVGADAQAALQVHLLRESRPQLFFSRIVNKAWYGIFGAEDILKASSVNLPHEITLVADGVEVPLPKDSQGIILLNIDSYAGGVPLWSLGSKCDSLISSPLDSHSNSWSDRPLIKRSRSLDMINQIKGKQQGERFHGSNALLERVDSVEDLAAALSLTDEEKFMRVTACDRPSSCQDGLLDIVSIRGAFHLGQIRVGLSNAQKLCQCREATITIKRKVSVQIDGEPWRQNVCTLRVRRKPDAAIMLHRSADDSNGVETEMANLLDWAENKKLIDERVHAVLMKEFSRRIESKTRRRREQNHRAGGFSLKRAIASSGNIGQGSGSGGIIF